MSATVQVSKTSLLSQGSQAYWDGKTTRDNPYPITSLRGELWERGYTEVAALHESAQRFEMVDIADKWFAQV